MVKHLNGWEMSKKLNANYKVFVKAFSGAKTTCMYDYAKPLVRINSSCTLVEMTCRPTNHQKK